MPGCVPVRRAWQTIRKAIVWTSIKTRAISAANTMSKKTIYLLIFISVFFILIAADRSSGSAQSTNRAALVVQFGDGTTETRCVPFDEQTITGYELLERSGFSFVASFETQGAAICKIEDEGCPANDCFCQSPPDYWSYWHLDGVDWEYSYQGSGLYTVEDGIVDGWAWGSGEPPPVVPFDQVCTPPTSTSTPTITHTPSLETTATETSPPTATQTSTTAAYPPPARATTTPDTRAPAQPTNTPAAALPSATWTPIPSGASAYSANSPSNPRIILPAIWATPTLAASPDSPSPIPPTATSKAAATPAPAASGGEKTQVQSGFPGSYLVFGVLAGSLLLIVFVQRLKHRQ